MSKKRAGNPHYYRIMGELMDLHESKNQDYCGAGGGGYEGLDNFIHAANWAGCGLRIVFKVFQGTKQSRIASLEAEDIEANHESITDSKRDLINYLALELAAEATYPELM